MPGPPNLKTQTGTRTTECNWALIVRIWFKFRFVSFHFYACIDIWKRMFDALKMHGYIWLVYAELCMRYVKLIRSTRTNKRIQWQYLPHKIFLPLFIIDTSIRLQLIVILPLAIILKVSFFTSNFDELALSRVILCVMNYSNTWFMHITIDDAFTCSVES